jgi:hypothetical protein
MATQTNDVRGSKAQRKAGAGVRVTHYDHDAPPERVHIEALGRSVADDELLWVDLEAPQATNLKALQEPLGLPEGLI